MKVNMSMALGAIAIPLTIWSVVLVMNGQTESPLHHVVMNDVTHMC